MMDQVVFYPKQAAHTASRKSIALKFISLWLILSLVLGGLAYYSYCFVLMSHGDINHDGVVNSANAAIIAGHSSDKTVVIVKSPTANVAAPKRVVTQPIVYFQ